jgi:hypothetical protein
MRKLAGGFLFLAGGLLAGAFSAYAMIQSIGVTPVAAGGPWLDRSAAMVTASDYYVRAHYMIEGRLPPAPGQLAEAVAETDSTGASLTSSCRYIIKSSRALPRWWSLGALNYSSSSLQAAADVDSVIREPDGSTVITASPVPQPGNWLKVPDKRGFALIYTTLSAGAAGKPALPPFTITREGC